MRARGFAVTLLAGVSLAAPLPAGENHWTLLTEQGRTGGGPVTASPFSPGVVYASGGSNVASISIDFGLTWFAAPIPLSQMPFQILVSGPPETVYLVTSSGLLWSTDPGNLWHSTARGPGDVAFAVRDESDAERVFVLRSVPLPCPHPWRFFCPLPPYPTELQAFECPIHGSACERVASDLYRVYSDDLPTETAIATSLADTSLYRIDAAGASPMGAGASYNAIEIHAEAGNPDRLYGLLRSDAFYRSDDRGIHWSEISDPAWTDVPSTFAVDPSRPGSLYAAIGRQVFVSRDAGATWAGLGRAVPDPIPGLSNSPLFTLAVSADGSTVYAGSYDGVYGFTFCEDCRSFATGMGADPRVVDPRP